MRISGFQKLTLLDYPGEIASTIFLGYCNLRCPFCHNFELVANPEKFPEIDKKEIFDFLTSRYGKLTGVAVTGGEPLLNNDIDELLVEIKKIGYKIKVDTNGFFSEKLNEIIDKKLVDMVAMDIKAGMSNYLKVAGLKDSKFNDVDFRIKIKDSISIIMKSGINYEFRTTCVKGLHTAADFYEIKDMIKGAKKYYLQNYRESDNMPILTLKPFTREELDSFLGIVKDSVDFVSIRGI